MPNNLSATSGPLVLSSEINEKIQVPIVSHKRRPSREDKRVANAVYAHIQAIRALGRNTINTADIAEALSISVYEVNRAITALAKKGVKPING